MKDLQAHFFSSVEIKVSKVNCLQIINKQRKIVMIGHLTANKHVISQSKEHKEVGLLWPTAQHCFSLLDLIPDRGLKQRS